MNLVYFALSVAGYYALHSLFASQQVKAFLMQLFPAKYYRLLFNLLSFVLLIPLICQYRIVEKQLIFKSSFLNEIPGLVVLVVSSVLMFFALRQYNLSEFSGFSYLKEESIHQSGNLNTFGLNAYVRHPLYFASLLFFWGLFLAVPNNAVLILAIISTFYLIVGTKLEESKLKKIFGEEYIDYQKRVPMLFPGFTKPLS